jgi:hypothetical protein
VVLETGRVRLQGSAAELRAAVVEKHGNSKSARKYLAAIAFIETCYAIDQETD